MVRVPAAGTVIVPRQNLCLDFANTVAWRGSEPEESLRTPDALIDWCESNGTLGDTSAHLRAWSRGHPEKAAVLFADAIKLRESIYRTFVALADSRAPEPADLALLKRSLAQAPVRRIVARVQEGFGWRLDHEPLSAASLLAPVLWSAGDLLVSRQLSRLRHCSNPKCLWLFLDDSKNGSRRWCSMQSCGNRAKAHRHYLKNKAPDR